MTVAEAAEHLRAAVLAVERQKVMVDALRDALRLNTEALNNAERLERDAEKELLRLSGGRYWDAESSSMKVDIQ